MQKTSDEMSFTHDDPGPVPLVALRAFIMAARHMNFTRAAQHLGVTQGAVSRHVATLETFSGARLFHRVGSTLALTAQGQQLFEAVDDAMSTMELTLRLLARRGQQPDRLRVRTSMPSFAMTVIVPALADYQSSHGVNVDLITSLSPPEVSDDFDVLISRDLHLTGTESWTLIRETLVCVAAPGLLAAQPAAALAFWPMVASASRPDVMATWAASAGIAMDRMRVVATYDHLFLAIMAAVNAAGFLVAPRLLVDDCLRAGTLVQVDPVQVVSGDDYVAYLNAQGRHLPTAQAFCRWLKGRLRQESADG